MGLAQVADDQGLIVGHLRSILLSLGFRTTAFEYVTDSKAALATLRQKRFDCCLVAMSGQRDDTRTCLREIRSSYAFKTLKLIAFGPRATKDEVVFAFEAGANLFLTYPFSPENVERVLDEARPR